MTPFHTSTLYRKLLATDRVAWVLAAATVPTITRDSDTTLEYHREHKKLWNIETHRRAARIRQALDDMVKYT